MGKTALIWKKNTFWVIWTIKVEILSTFTFDN